MSSDRLVLEELDRCFEGAIPAVISTAAADGTPNITYISKAHRVDDERVALSNQFMSKTARNLAINPRASLLLIQPLTHAEFRLSLVYERTERRGHVFDKLRADVDAIASFTGMQHVFRLRAADIFRVVDAARVPPNPMAPAVDEVPPARATSAELSGLAQLAAAIGRAGDLDVLVDAALEVLDRSLGYEHSQLLLLDEDGHRLYTIASRGFGADSIGAEVVVGDGLIGMAAQRCEPIAVGNLLQMAKYSRAMRREFEDSGGLRPGREVPIAGLAGADSRLVVPAKALGQLVGVLVVDSTRPVAFGTADEQTLGVAATMIASAIEHIRSLEREQRDQDVPAEAAPASPPVATERLAAVRFFAVDGSTFLDGEYLIKGVAGRILRSLLSEYVAEGRTDFTNKELRLDPSLEMPGFKDNLESRLILLKRRLDEREAPVRIERTGRGRFHLHVDRLLRLDCVEA